MQTVSVSFYGLKAKTDDVRFKNLMAEANQWTPLQVDEFLLKNDMGILRGKTVEEAISLIQAFREVGVIGGIGGLDNVGYYTRQFQKFYENEGQFKITWNWTAAIFNWLWLLFRGLWAKWMLYGLIATAVSLLLFSAATMLGNMTILSFLSIAGWVGTLCFVGMVGNYDYFLKKTKNENLWPKFPFQKYKPQYWLAVLVLLIPILGWYGIQAKNMVAVQQQMMHPKMSEEKPVELSGVEYTAPAGWQILPSFPSQFGMMKGKSQSVVFLIGGQKQGQTTTSQKSFGQLFLQIFEPKSGTFNSLTQKEVQEIVKPYSKGFDQIQFKVMGVSTQSAQPVFFKIGEQQWGKIVSSTQFKGAPSEAAFANFVYYSIINNQLVVLYYQGSKNPEGVTEKAIEDFAGTFKPSNKATA